MPPSDAVPAAFDLSRSFSGEALGIAVTGMLIVFAALLVISLFIQLLPTLLQQVAAYLPEEFEPPAPEHPENAYPDEDALVAALGYILHTELKQRSK